LQEFLKQIKSSKTEYNYRVSNKPQNRKQEKSKARYGSSFSTSSGGNQEIKMEARHFRNKEGAMWLNMFETISSNYCLNNASNIKGPGTPTRSKQ
jgi:hypothetical protein